MEEVTDKKTWEKLVNGFASPTFLQSWNWGETQREMGKKIWRFKLPHGIAQIVKEQARRGSYLTCPGGPLINWNKESLREFTQILKKIAKREGVIFCRIRPMADNIPENRDIAKSLGYIPSPMHMHAETTWQLDVTPSEEQILADMRKTTRYLIRKATNMGVVIKKTTELKGVRLLYDLEIETATRHNFVPFKYDFLESHFKNFVKDGQLLIFEGEWNREVISSAMIVFYGKEATYHYSGSSGKFPEVPVNYLLQWEVIKEAKKRGMAIYNFWGIAPNDDPTHRFAGVTTFKKGFGGFKKDYLHAHDLPMSPLYWGVNLFENLRRKLRHL